MNKPSEKFKKTFSVKTDAKTNENFIFIKNNVRFSVLTSRLIRVEVSKTNEFCDEPTQAFLFRNIDKPKYKITEKGNIVAIGTEDVVFYYDIKNKKMQNIMFKDKNVVSDFEKGNLKGTYRTLDMADGSVPLGNGLMSKNGVSVIDDSKSLIINSDGTMKERAKCEDKYYFAYGRDYRGCLKDFFKLSGEVPLVPRYCLGNWWSRYKAYTQDEYIDLMNNFIDKEIPITVATVDMDWHWVDIKKQFGKEAYNEAINPINNHYFHQGAGWTGYSWNTDLFPDYKYFLKWLKDKGFKVTLNLHPAQGVKAFEDMYPQMAERMGIDPKTKESIKFDITDPKYIEAYFDILHKPYEKEGVDFWWIDWQQEKTTNIKGLDPLWALNHYHTLAFNGENKRPLILSRFAEVGSHRYPLGFSGDAFTNWNSLDFQPYFTITATNIGYTWWSHDIGGHNNGERNDELYLRWVQFGEYSPIMRLHSTSDEFMGKEPWKFSYAANNIATSVLRERHSMIPYIYSMNYRTHKDGIALCEPMYYSYPNKEEAYQIKNEYFFGSELLVAPITSPVNKTTNLAETKVWLPKGQWTDIYNGNIYEGEKFVTMYRGVESIPVLAKEGAIIPLSQNDRTNDSSNPKDMKIRIYNGTNEFELYEDDGETMNFKSGAFSITKMKQEVINNNLSFVVEPAQGDVTVLPKERNYAFVFENVSSAEKINVTLNSQKIDANVYSKNGKTYVNVNGVKPADRVVVELNNFTERKNRDKKEHITEIISKYQMITHVKMILFSSYIKNIDGSLPVVNSKLKGPIEEVNSLKY